MIFVIIRGEMIYYMEVGGIFMWPILILAVFALAVILEKIYYYLFISRDLNSNFKINLLNVINTGDRQKIIDFCKKYKNPLAKATIQTLNSSKNIKTKEEFSFILETCMEGEIKEFEKGGWILGICVAATPQLGLLGTITGMIKSFGALSNTGDPTMVASGISEALYTTAFGLIVAIPVLIYHVAINVKNDKLIEELGHLEMLLNKNFSKFKALND